ncbi:hypothetical protein M404DRAFT_995761 [Pisolithus tinctorius Marx 270]|uniref:Uncharacterized protein n=1 Tax=Pisolithus tinctorius Marx 270 TaxID=870435 RepID=A0A0C3KLR9_PISTI|nr:hypothetical protein M404DRAFT_995761 [Pisolithus tinctorius Marx 270]
MDQFEYDGFGLPDSVSPWTSLAGPQPDRRSLLQDQNRNSQGWTAIPRDMSNCLPRMSRDHSSPRSASESSSDQKENRPVTRLAYPCYRVPVPNPYPYKF